MFADRRKFGVVLRACCLFLMAGSIDAAEPLELITRICRVGPEGKGHVEAIDAVRELSQSDASALIPILKSFDSASPLAANWLLGAAEVIADRALREKKLSAKELEAFVIDTDNHARARRLAYQWLLKLDPGAEARLIPGMLQDPGAAFRRDAVTLLLVEAEQLLNNNKVDAAKAVYVMAMKGAVDDDQVKAIVKPLKELGIEVDLPSHFGFLTRWKVIGPFDNTDKKGFNAIYPPERELKFKANYRGKMGEITWQDVSTEDDYGKVDLTKALAPHKGAVTYAVATFKSTRSQLAELRLGTPNAWKLWVNGEQKFAHEEYHRGSRLDQYTVPVQLKPGNNTILLKICQNEQTEDWAQAWEYQLRVCNSAGVAIRSTADATTKSSRPEIGQATP